MSVASNFNPDEPRDAHGRWIHGFGHLKAIVDDLEKAGKIDSAQHSAILKAMERHSAKGRGIPHDDSKDHAKSLEYLARTLRQDSLNYRQGKGTSKNIPISKQLSRTARAVENALAATQGKEREGSLSGVEANKTTPKAEPLTGTGLAIATKLKTKATDVSAPKNQAQKNVEEAQAVRASEPKGVFTPDKYPPDSPNPYLSRNYAFRLALSKLRGGESIKFPDGTRIVSGDKPGMAQGGKSMPTHYRIHFSDGSHQDVIGSSVAGKVAFDHYENKQVSKPAAGGGQATSGAEKAAKLPAPTPAEPEAKLPAVPDKLKSVVTSVGELRRGDVIDMGYARLPKDGGGFRRVRVRRQVLANDGGHLELGPVLDPHIAAGGAVHKWYPAEEWHKDVKPLTAKNIVVPLDPSGTVEAMRPAGGKVSKPKSVPSAEQVIAVKKKQPTAPTPQSLKISDIKPGEKYYQVGTHITRSKSEANSVSSANGVQVDEHVKPGGKGAAKLTGEVVLKKKVQQVKIRADGLQVGDVINLGSARVYKEGTTLKKKKYFMQSKEQQAYDTVKVERRVESIHQEGENGPVVMSLSAPLDPRLAHVDNATSGDLIGKVGKYQPPKEWKDNSTIADLNYYGYGKLYTGNLPEVRTEGGRVVTVKRTQEVKQFKGGKIKLSEAPSLDQYHAALSEAIDSGISLDDLKTQFDPANRPLRAGHHVGHAQEILFDMAVGKVSGNVQKRGKSRQDVIDGLEKRGAFDNLRPEVKPYTIEVPRNWGDPSLPSNSIVGTIQINLPEPGSKDYKPPQIEITKYVMAFDTPEYAGAKEDWINTHGGGSKKVDEVIKERNAKLAELGASGVDKFRADNPDIFEGAHPATYSDLYSARERVRSFYLLRQMEADKPVTFDAQAFVKSLNITDAQAQAWYDDPGNKFSGGGIIKDSIEKHDAAVGNSVEEERRKIIDDAMSKETNVVTNAQYIQRLKDSGEYTKIENQANETTPFKVSPPRESFYGVDHANWGAAVDVPVLHSDAKDPVTKRNEQRMQLAKTLRAADSMYENQRLAYLTEFRKTHPGQYADFNEFVKSLNLPDDSLTKSYIVGEQPPNQQASRIVRIQRRTAEVKIDPMVKETVDKLRQQEGTVARDYHIPTWDDMKLEDQTWESLSQRLQLQHDRGTKDFTPTIYNAAMVTDGVLYHRVQGEKKRKPKADQSLRDALIPYTSSLPTPGTAEEQAARIAPDGADFRTVSKNLDSALQGDIGISKSGIDQMKSLIGRHFTQVPIERADLRELIEKPITDGMKLPAGQYGYKQAGSASVTEAMSELLKTPTVEDVERKLKLAKSSEGYKLPGSTDARMRLPADVADAALKAIDEYKRELFDPVHVTTGTIPRDGNTEMKKIMEKAGASEVRNSTSPGGKGSWTTLKPGKMLLIQEGGVKVSEEEALKKYLAQSATMPSWTDYSASAEDTSPALHTDWDAANTLDEKLKVIDHYEKALKGGQSWANATPKTKKSLSGWADNERVKIAAARESHKSVEGEPPLKRIEFVPWIQSEPTTQMPRSARGRLSLVGYTPDEAAAKLRDLGVVGDLEPQIPGNSIFRTDRRVGNVSPLHPAYVRGDAAPPDSKALLTHGVTSRNEKPFDAFKRIMESNGLMGISERFKRGIGVSSTSQTGDIGSGIDHVTFLSLDSGGACGSGAPLRFILKPDAFMRRDALLSPTDFGGGHDRYPKYKKYRDDLEAKAGLEVGKSDLWTPLDPKARQAHLDNLNKAPGSSEYNLAGQISIEDCQAIAVSDDGLRQQVVTYLQELKTEGLIESIPDVVLTSDFKNAVQG